MIFVGTGVDDDFTPPSHFQLSQPFPNPFNSQTTIRFAVPQSENVRLTLTDVLGREVRRLADEEFKAGNHRLTLEAGDLPTGLYMIRMEAGSFRAGERLLLIR